jgi:osmotically-inducible protein OsmY
LSIGKFRARTGPAIGGLGMRSGGAKSEVDRKEQLMKREQENQRVWTKIVGSAAVGALAMYALDPDKGRRRRALARDKARSLMGNTRDAVGVTRRDVAHRIEGLRARARRMFWQRPAPDDLQLIERVRARMGRLVSHPHAIQVGARKGTVTLSGPILTREVEPLLNSVRTVWGVADVEDRLVAYERPEHISSLQGGTEPRTMRSVVMQENWPPALRAAALLGGTLLTLRGLHRGSFGGFALTLLGLGLAVRGATNQSLSRLADNALRRSSLVRDATGGESTSARDHDAKGTNGGPSIYDAPPESEDTGPALH